MAKVVARREMSALEASWLPEIARGMGITMRHFARSLVRPQELTTLRYPEERPDVPRNYRARHRLMKRPDGQPRCVACYMCSTACPARCIRIEAMASDDPRIEKKPARFEIDLLVCVFCGLCVEACPVDAIRMDTGDAVVAADARHKFVVRMDDLLEWSPKDYPVDDAQSQKAPGGALNDPARKVWGIPS